MLKHAAILFTDFKCKSTKVLRYSVRSIFVLLSFIVILRSTLIGTVVTDATRKSRTLSAGNDPGDQMLQPRPRGEQPNLAGAERASFSKRMLMEPIILLAYVASIVLVVGWQAYRQYYVVWAIDPAGVDAASPDITLNYIGFGIWSFIYFFQTVASSIFFWLPRSLSDYSIVFGTVTIALIALAVHSFLHVKQLSIKWKWADPAFVLVFLVIPCTYYAAIMLGSWSGRAIALTENDAPLANFYPVKFTVQDQPYDFKSGCWLLLKMDKKTLYTFRVATPELRQEGVPVGRVVNAIPLSSVSGLKIYPNVTECPRTPSGT